MLEDDRTSRKLLVWILEQAGYDVIECSEGRDAIHMSMMNPPAVIVVDVMLPDMRGTDVVEELLSLPACRHIKSIFLTGILTRKAQESDSQFHFDVNGRSYRALAKPVRKSVLLRLLRETVAEADAEAQERARADRRGAAPDSEHARQGVSADAAAPDIDEDAMKNSPLWES